MILLVCSVPYVSVSAHEHCALLVKVIVKIVFYASERETLQICVLLVSWRGVIDSHLQFIANPYSSHNETKDNNNNFAPCPVCQLRSW